MLTSQKPKKAHAAGLVPERTLDFATGGGPADLLAAPEKINVRSFSALLGAENELASFLTPT
jgi:hypothetical protein